jgi:type II secretory pathway pseudopilin PulG
MGRMRNQKGFTVVELLVVVVIIMTLIAIGIPTYNAVIRRGKEAAHDANVRQLTQVAQMWQADNLGKGTQWPDYPGYEEYIEWPEPVLESGGRDGRGGYMVTVHNDGRVEVSPAAKTYGW